MLAELVLLCCSLLFLLAALGLQLLMVWPLAWPVSFVSAPHGVAPCLACTPQACRDACMLEPAG